MDLEQHFPRDLDEERRIGWLGWLILTGIGGLIIFSAGITEKLADWIKPMTWLMSIS